MRQQDTIIRIQNKLIEMLGKKPIYQIKVKELAGLVGISRTTFYQYYDSVYAVLQDIIDTFLEELLVNLEDEGYFVGNQYLTEPHPRILKGLEYLKKNARTYCALMGPNADPSFRRKTSIALTALLTDGIATKMLDLEKGYDDDRKRLIVEFVREGHHAVTLYWLSNNTDVSAEEMAVLRYRLIYSAFCMYKK